MELKHFNQLSFYKNRIAINLLAKNTENAKEVLDAIEGYGVIGVVSKQFQSVEEGIGYVEKFKREIPAVSIGLGDGDPSQWKMAAEIAAGTDPGHVNQIFSAAGYTLGRLEGNNCRNTIVNALISPTGQPGEVKISTGAISAGERDAIVAVHTAVAMLKEIGIPSVKYYHIQGDKRLEELRAVAQACAKLDMPMLEPTGGITEDNIRPILQVCLEAGCRRIMPHVYSAIIDKNTGLTDPEAAKAVYRVIQTVY